MEAQEAEAAQEAEEAEEAEEAGSGAARTTRVSKRVHGLELRRGDMRITPAQLSTAAAHAPKLTVRGACGACASPAA